MLSQDTRQLLRLFAEIIDYPGDSLLRSVNDCANRLANLCPKAAKDMNAFSSFIESENMGRVEEVYTRTFDIAPTTTLYAGYHLFGESYKRGTFLVTLQEAYRKHDFDPGLELADHLPRLLEFASVADDPEFVNPLLAECIIPVIEKMEGSFDGGGNGYNMAISSLKCFLRQEYAASFEAGGLHHE